MVVGLYEAVLISLYRHANEKLEKCSFAVIEMHYYLPYFCQTAITN